jgi:DNA-binding protein H-NS
LLVSYHTKIETTIFESSHMSTVAQLLAQKAALDAQIEAARKSENAEAIAQVKGLVAEHGLTQQDVFGGAKRGRKASGSVAPKYKDPISGNTWSGRGKAPKWIEGQDRGQYSI